MKNADCAVVLIQLSLHILVQSEETGYTQVATRTTRQDLKRELFCRLWHFTSPSPRANTNRPKVRESKCYLQPCTTVVPPIQFNSILFYLYSA